MIEVETKTALIIGIIFMFLIFGATLLIVWGDAYKAVETGKTDAPVYMVSDKSDKCLYLCSKRNIRFSTCVDQCIMYASAC